MVKRLEESNPNAREILKGAAFLLIAIFIAYLPAIRGGFIWDDPQYVLKNPTLRSIDGLREMWLVPTSLPQWYPLVHTTFWIEYALVGTHPLLYHIDNVILHAISSMLIWRTLRRLEVPGAFLAASLFALHPAMVESVAWVTERKNVLSLLFYLLAMRVYLFQFDPANSGEGKANWRGYALSLVFFACALFSKTVTASLPAAILLILWWKRGRLRVRDVLPLIPFLLLGALLAWETGRLEQYHVGASGDITPELRFTLVQRCLIAGRAIWFYLGKLLWPHPLVFIYPRWNSIDVPSAWQWGFPAAVLIATIALFALRNRIGRGPLVAWLLFCGTLFPALGFVNVFPMRYSFVADHFQYHACIAIFAALGASAACLGRYLAARMRGAIWGTIVIVLGALTFSQSRQYKDAWTLWIATRERNPDSWMVWANLGNVLAEQSRDDEAMPYYLHAVDLAPNLAETSWIYGIALMKLKQPDAAEQQFAKALRLDPGFQSAYDEALGEIEFYHRNNVGRAIELYRKSLAISPEFAKANYFLGVALEQKAGAARQRFEQTRNEADGKLWLDTTTDAIEHYRAAAASEPDNFDAQYNLGNCLSQIRQFDEAIEHLRQAARIEPTSSKAWTNLGNAYFQSKRWGNAAGAFERALRIDPNLEPAKRGLQAAKSRVQ